MEWREVDNGLADFHMSIGVWTPFSTEGSGAAGQRWILQGFPMIYFDPSRRSLKGFVRTERGLCCLADR